MAHDHDQLRAMVQKDRESFKEYAQRWSEVVAQVIPPMEEKEMTKIFLKTLGAFYYERMVASAPSDFTEMVGMGICLEEAVREGRLTKSEGSGGVKKPSYGFTKKKEGGVNAVIQERRVNAPRRNYQRHQQVASVTPVMNAAPNIVAYQRQFQQGNQGNNQRRENYEPIPMSYAELLPALIQKNLVQTRPPPAVPSPLPWYYKADQTCAFHQGAPGHNVENCYPLKTEVQKLVKSGVLSFKDAGPNVKDNPLPKHGGVNVVNMVAGCPGDFRIFDINLVRGDLVKMHADLCEFSYYTP